MFELVSYVNFIAASWGFIFTLTLIIKSYNDKRNLLIAFIFFHISHGRLISFSFLDFSETIKKILFVISFFVRKTYFILPVIILAYTIISIYGKIEIKKVHILHFVPFLVCDTFFITTRNMTPDTFVYGTPEKIRIINVFANPRLFIHLLSIDLMSSIYITISILILSRHLISVYKLQKEKIALTHKWLMAFLILLLSNYLIRFGGQLAGFLINKNMNIYIYSRFWGDLILSIAIMTTTFVSFFTNLNFDNTEKIRENHQFSISTKKTTRIMSQLTFYMEKEKPYLEPRLTIRDLARNMGIYVNELSYIINITTKDNFQSFVNDFRIAHVKRCMEENVVRKKEDNLINIAMDSGFNSKSSFNAVFKKKTGVTPSVYKKQLVENLASSNN